MKKIRERIIRPFTKTKNNLIQWRDKWYERFMEIYNCPSTRKVRLIFKELFLKSAIFGFIIFGIHLLVKAMGLNWNYTNEIAAALFVFSPTFMITFIWRQYDKIEESIEIYNYAETLKDKVEKTELIKKATVMFIANINKRMPAPIHCSMFGLAAYSITHYVMNSYNSFGQEIFYVAGLAGLWYLQLKVALEIDDPIDGCYHLQIPSDLRKYIRKEEGIRAKIKSWI